MIPLIFCARSRRVRYAAGILTLLARAQWTEEGTAQSVLLALDSDGTCRCVTLCVAHVLMCVYVCKHMLVSMYCTRYLYT